MSTRSGLKKFFNQEDYRGAYHLVDTDMLEFIPQQTSSTLHILHRRQITAIRLLNF